MFLKKQKLFVSFVAKLTKVSNEGAGSLQKKILKSSTKTESPKEKKKKLVNIKKTKPKTKTEILPPPS